MLKRYKKVNVRKEHLRYFNLYNVESIFDYALIYLADKDNFAMLRHGELAVIPLNEADSLIERITDSDIKEEAREVLEDFRDIKRYGCSNWHYTGSEVVGGKYEQA